MLQPQWWRLVQVDGKPTPNDAHKRRRLRTHQHMVGSAAVPHSAASHNRLRGLRRRRITEDAGLEKLTEHDVTAGRDRGPGGGDVEVEGGGNRRRRWEVRFGLGSAEGTGGAVVGQGCLLGRVERSQPNPSSLPRVAYLGGVATPGSLSDPSVVSLAKATRRRRRHQHEE